MEDTFWGEWLGNFAAMFRISPPLGMLCLAILTIEMRRQLDREMACARF